MAGYRHKRTYRRYSSEKNRSRGTPQKRGGEGKYGGKRNERKNSCKGDKCEEGNVDELDTKREKVRAGGKNGC